MTTPYRGYTEIPSGVVPDVPYRTNLALREIDADMDGALKRTAALEATSASSSAAIDELEDSTTEHGARIALVEAAAGFEEPPLGFQDEIVDGLLGNPASETAKRVATAVRDGIPVVYMLGMGAKADNVTDDWTYFNQARTKAGAGGVVWFDNKRGQASTTYFFDRERPGMAGVAIGADPGVIIRITDESPETAALTLVSPVTFQSMEGNYTTRRPANDDLQTAVAMAANVRPQTLGLTADPFTGSWSGLLASTLGGKLVRQASTATLEANKVSWAAYPGFAVMGADRVPVLGSLFEITVEESDTAGGQVGPMFLSADDTFAWFRAATGTGVFSSSASTLMATPPVYASLATPNGEAYQLSTSITWGVKFHTLRHVSLYVNGLYLHDATFTADIAKFGIVNTTNRNTTFTLRNPVKYSAFEPLAPVPASVSIVGDSISRGAWSTITYGDLLPVAAAGLRGGGDIVVRQNLAISGSSAWQWADPARVEYIGAHDFTADDYVLVMLGTNDTSTARTSAEYEASLGTIAAKIVADGAKPIFGIFPTWTNLAVTGTGGGATAYNSAARLRAVLVRWAAEQGHEVAMVNDAFGANIGQLPDNIHPDPRGQAAIARAFAQAIARIRLRFAQL